MIKVGQRREAYLGWLFASTIELIVQFRTMLPPAVLKDVHAITRLGPGLDFSDRFP